MNRTKPIRALEALQTFYGGSLDHVLSEHQRTDPSRRVVELFHDAAQDVPAYAQFLANAGVDPHAVRTLEDFSRLPPTTKDNYYRVFALEALCRGGLLESCDFVSVSSGSTGEPAVWPRFVSDEIGSTHRFEQVLSDAMGASTRRTLAVICFALGSWVGGMYTTAACRHIAAKGYPLTVVTPGNDRREILRVVRALAPSFDQVVLFGYPPFLKDIIDAGRADGLAWDKNPVGLVAAGEVFSETWRSLVCERLGRADAHLCTASVYGTADGGVLANETPASIRIRRWLAERPAAARALFGEARLPTLCQYDPLHRYFQVEGDELLFSGDGGAPLVRYRILDRGGRIDFDDLMTFLNDQGGSELVRDLAAGRDAPLRRLPFVYVFGRANFALSFYGANVYPENVAPSLERPPFAHLVTGKFVMQIVRDRDEDPSLHIAVELAARAEPGADFARDLAASIRSEMERVNSEFLHYAPADRRTPTLALLPLGDATYFPPGVKHRYSRA